MSQHKKVGVSLIAENSKGEILLMLRDNNPNIPYPNYWYTPGGTAEEGETPEEAIRREMQEEMELSLPDLSLYKVFDWPDDSYVYTDHVFYIQADLDPVHTPLHEGQMIKFFTRTEVEALDLAFRDNVIMRDFFTYRA